MTMTDPRPDPTVERGSAHLSDSESTGRRSRRGRRSQAPPPDDLGPDADPEAMAREIVLRKLTAQARSRSELAKALKQRAVPEDAASAVLDRMEEVGLVDDAAFADAWVRSRQSRRHLSRRALRQELVRKGVERDDIDNALEQVGSDDEYESAKALAAKKARGMSGLDRQVQYRRLAGALARRGFSSGVSGRVLQEVLDASGDDETPFED
jgi:regulatory protein